MITHRRALLAGAVGAIAAPAIGRAQDEWPRRPIRIIIPYAPGGGTDAVTRLLAEAIRPILGQPIVIENRPGANGVIGTEVVARSQPDGYTFVAVTSGHLTNRYVMPSIPYDPVRDFTPVCTLSIAPMVLAASTATPYEDLRGMVAYARANPRAVTYGTSTAVNSYVGNSFARMVGVEMTEVPYRGGGPMMTDIIAGNLQLGWGFPESALSQLQGGRLRIIGQTSKERPPVLHEVPSISELGFPDFDVVGWVGLYGPANLPAAIVDRVYAALAQAIANPLVRQRVTDMGNFGTIEDPTKFARRIQDEDRRWARAAEDGMLTRAG